MDLVTIHTKLRAPLHHANTTRIKYHWSITGDNGKHMQVGGVFLGNFLKPDPKIYIPKPSWGNHWAIMREAGLPTERYRYYSRKSNGLDFQGMPEDVEGAGDGNVVLLHACVHNPTGCDPSEDQWKQIAAVVREKGHIAFFNSAYQGFASGDAEKDAFALRYFVSEGLPVVLAQSFAKNVGLYGERCAALS